ncbi:MAG: hypothetical protein QOG13_8 [Sphingomonadales bacterium]|nr:hypothetical protein [Sphingomonadales bacterium]
MNPDRIERLTDKQRQCLRLVYAHKETKEIARILGLSPDGVTQRIKAAMRTLGVDKRRDAALILAEAEDPTTYPRRVYPSGDIASGPEQAMFAASTEGGRQSGSSAEAVREEQAAFWAAPLSRGPALPFSVGEARPDDVGLLIRLAWIAGIAIGIALAFGALVAGIEALTRLVWS